MVLSSEVIAEADGWRVKKMVCDGEFSHYVLNHELESGHATNSFDEVHATGGLLKLKRNGETTVTFTGVIDGLNTFIEEDSDMPIEIFGTLVDIGPY